MSRTQRGFAAFCVALSLGLPVRARAEDRPILELSLQEAVARALEGDVDIAVARYNPEDSAEAVKQIDGSYEPLLFSTLAKNSTTSPASSALTGGSKVETNTFTYNFGVSQALKTGGSFRIDFNNNKQDTNSVFTTFNPAFNSSLNLRLGQPLVKNLRIDQTRQLLRIAKKNKEISDLQFVETVKNTTANVKNLYYDLLYSMDNLEAQRKSLSLAQKLLGENQIKVRVGTMAPLDVVAAESEVASREENVIVAEAALADAEDALRQALFPLSDSHTWNLRIVPTDRPTAEPVPVDVEAAVKKALDSRTDVVNLRKRLENADISLQFTKNQLLPQVDLVAAYGAAGLGGTQLRDASGQPLPQPITGGYGDAVSDVFGRDFPTWTVGVSLSYPILNRNAKATSARARVARDQTEANVRRLELLVTGEVRSAARAVESNLKRVQSTRAARVLQERRLDAEEKKFAAGMSTNFLVTQAQRDLAVAEVAEVRSVADYRKSVVNFERVQEVGVSGVTSTATLSSASSTSNRTAGVSTQQ